MRLICPSCGAAAGADVWENDAVMREFARVLAELPAPVARCALSYLALFRPRSGAGLQWKKALRLLGELSVVVSDSYVQWDNQPARPADAATWGRAMERMCAHRPRRLPLKNHNYLRSVAYEIANETDRTRETARNQSERSGNAAPRKPEATDGVPPPEGFFEEIRSRINGIGKKI